MAFKKKNNETKKREPYFPKDKNGEEIEINSKVILPKPDKKNGDFWLREGMIMSVRDVDEDSGDLYVMDTKNIEFYVVEPERVVLVDADIVVTPPPLPPTLPSQS